MGLTHILEPGMITIKLDDTKRYQKMIGFGAAITETVGIHLLQSNLSDASKDKVFRAYFSDEGI